MAANLTPVGPAFPSPYIVIQYGYKVVDTESPQRFAELLEIRDPPEEHQDWKYIIFSWSQGTAATYWYAFESLDTAQRAFEAARSIKGRIDADGALFKLLGGLVITGHCSDCLPWFYRKT